MGTKASAHCQRVQMRTQGRELGERGVWPRRSIGLVFPEAAPTAHSHCTPPQMRWRVEVLARVVSHVDAGERRPSVSLETAERFRMGLPVRAVRAEFVGD